MTTPPGRPIGTRRGDSVVVDVRARGAVGDGEADDSATIQAALDYVASLATGGAVYIPRGIYRVSSPLAVGANTRVFGDGIGLTVLRGPAGNYVSGTTVNGSDFYATIGAVGRSRVVIEDLTVDHQTNGTEANGIGLVPAGAFEGTPCSHVVVQRCEVLGHVVHEYLIWSLRGQHIKILNNHVDGFASSWAGALGQEGIEVFGGYDVLVQGNSIARIENAGVFVGAANDMPNAECVGVIVADNHIEDVRYGVYVGTAIDTNDDDAPQDITHCHVRGNIIRGCYADGVRLSQQAAAGTLLTDVQVANNSIDDALVGVQLFGQAAETTENRGVCVAGNVIRGSRTTALGGIAVIYTPNAEVKDNVVIDSAGDGIYAQDAPDLIIERNRTDTVAKRAAFATGCDRLCLRDNHFKDHGSLAPDTYVGVVLASCDDGLVERNTFDQVTPFLEILIGGTNNRITMSKNRRLYSPADNDGDFSNTSVDAVND